MRKNFGVQTWLYPMPVLIIGTYNEDGTPNAMNAAWGGIHDTNQISVCIDPSHKTAENIRKRGFFTVSIADAAHAAECDFVGIVSGNDTADKLDKINFHTRRAEFADAPVIDELPMTIECKLVSFDSTAGCTVGEILNISADETILGDDGKISVEKLQPVTYDPVHHTYIKLGSIAGKAFSDGKKFK
ncbi:MAG: flavin reductase family protein [Lentisphaeria bacterium]|nr:flavin reductase family protein [Lentisphaeria bacterium]